MNAKSAEGVLLHHVIVIGGSTLEWSEVADEAWQVRLAELGKVADHVGASWLTLRPFLESASSTVLPAREQAVGSCLVAAQPQADGRERLAQVARQLQAAGTPITEASISAALNAPALADPDLVVVVGGRHRMPPSLVWELAYSELVYVDTNWLHFGPGHLDEAIGSFAHRHRRFGGIDERAVASHLYRDTAVVLRTYKLGEADRIVVLLTEHHGKVRAVAKGVRKTMSRFGARLEPMSHVRLLLAQGRELDIVSQAETVESLAPMMLDLDHLTSGIAVLEAADQMSLDREPNPQLYRMVVGALRTIGERGGALVVPAFFWKLLAAEGVAPELDECVRCGEPGPLVAFDMNQGGALCRTCRTGAPLSEDALELMRMILGGRLKDALATAPSRATHEVATHATRALEHHIERRLRTVAMFETH